MALVARTFSWLPNPDGTVDGHNPLGDKAPHVSALAWGDLSAFIAAIQQTATGSSLSDNARMALSGTNAATATITWETVSGADVTATGFTVSGDNVLISSSTQGGGFGRLGANDGTGIVYSAPIQWTRIAAPTDVLAPTTPTGLLGTPIAGGITWTWDPTSDPHDGTHAGSGVKEYDLELNGAIMVVAGLPGVVTAPTVSNIGTISNPGAPTAVQSGRNWTLTAAGTGADGTSDQILFLNWPLSGDCRVVAKINSVGGAGSTFGVAGLMIRESLAVDSKYVAIDQFRSAQSQPLQGKQRITTGGARSNLSTGVGTNTPRWAMLERVGNVFTLSYSLDGMAWAALDSTTIPMTSSVYVGGFATSLSAGNEVIGVLNDLNVSSAPRASYTQTTSSATTARVRARDLQSSPNVGSYCSLSPSITPLVSNAPAHKFNPGFYPFESNYTAYNTARVNEICALANCQGYKIRVRWREIETSRGVYSWTFLDGLLAIVATAGRRLIIEFITNSFDGNNPIPAYLATEPNAAGGWYVKTDSLGQTAGYQPKVYIAAVMDRILALAQAVATKYDTNPNVEAFVFLPESALPQAPADFNPPAYKAQLLRFISTAPSYAPRTAVLLGLNFGFGSNRSYFSDFLAAMALSGCGTNNPDIYISSDDFSSDADKATRGLIWNGSAWVAGGTDYRGVIPISHDIQSPELGGKENTSGGQTIDALMTHDTTVNKSNYVCPLYKDYEIAPKPTPPDVYWDHTKSYAVNKVSGSQDIKTMISSGSYPLVSTLPTAFGSNGSVFPDPSSFFSDDFESGGLTTTNGEGWSWAGYDSTSIVKQSATQGNVLVSDGTNHNLTINDGRDWTAFEGLEKNCLRFRFVAGGPSFPEQRFDMGVAHPEVWFRWWMRVPTNFAPDSANDKFFALWNDTYEVGNGSTAYLSHWPNGASPGTTRDIAYTYSPGNGSPSIGYAGYTPFFTTSDHGRWMQLAYHVKSETSPGAANGMIELWKRWHGDANMTRLLNGTGLGIKVGTAGHAGFYHGYLMGSNESGFYAAQTEFLWDRFEASLSSLVV